MLELLAESALRSIVLGGVASFGLKLMRVRHPQLQMTVWTIVLIVSLAIPILTPWMHVALPISPSPAPLQKITWIELPGINTHTSQPAERSAFAAPRPDFVVSVPPRWDEWRAWATRLYLAVSGAMLLRLLIGLTVMLRVVRAAHPVRDRWGEGDVRLSNIVAVPVTFASTILMPPRCTAWDARKLQAALLHEKSHVRRGDFYLLLLASTHRAVFWFNPFAWWLFTRLAELAEAVSDDAAIAGLGGDRNVYAGILVEMATASQRLSEGLAMARPRTVHRRVLRILTESGTPAEIEPCTDRDCLRTLCDALRRQDRMQCHAPTIRSRTPWCVGARPLCRQISDGRGIGADCDARRRPTVGAMERSAKARIDC